MKRSKSLSLILMGSILAASYGCSSESTAEERFDAFSSVEECVKSDLYAPDECSDFAEAAKDETPKFSSKEECEEKFGEGSCDNQSSTAKARPDSYANNGQTTVYHSGSSWMPMMMGFMAGRYLGNNGPMYGAQPLFRQNNTGSGPNGAGGTAGTQSFRTAKGETVRTDSKGRVTTPASSLKQSVSHSAKPAIARTTSRSSGGFSGGMGSFGGASS